MFEHRRWPRPADDAAPAQVMGPCEVDADRASARRAARVIGDVAIVVRASVDAPASAQASVDAPASAPVIDAVLDCALFVARRPAAVTATVDDAAATRRLLAVVTVVDRRHCAGSHVAPGPPAPSS